MHFIQTCKAIVLKEELLIDLDATTKEIKFTIGTLSEIKKTIPESPNLILDAFSSSLSEFTIKPTFPFPEFVHWAVKNYVPSTKQFLSADGTQVICTINSGNLRKSFFLPNMNLTQNPMQFSEENNLAIIKALEPNQTSTFMSKMFNPNISP